MSDPYRDVMQAIPGPCPAGEDISYAPLFDQIREARRQDDPALAMGEWTQTLKVADWPRVIRLCEDALCQQSKDLQLLVWYAEALTRSQGFTGACRGLQALQAWLQQYWEQGYPLYEAQDLDERVAKLCWLDQTLALALRQVPLVAPACGAYHWLDWQQSREVDNLALKDVAAWQAALAEGKLSGEHFDKAAQDSGSQWFQSLAAQLAALQQAYRALDAAVEERFGQQAPALAGLRDSLQACHELVARYRPPLEAKGLPAAASPPPVADPAAGPAPLRPLPAAGLPPLAQRQQAVAMLLEVARYFRQHEPHSPVALLVERAARWADMSLEQWLQHVVKDEATLSQLQTLLDVRETR